MDLADILHFFRTILPKQEIRSRIHEWIATSVSVNIMISGKTGTGKSTLVNGITGRNLDDGGAAEGNTLNPETSEVKIYQNKIDDVQVNVYDTPGLQDGTVKEAEYLKDIETRCKDAIDLFIYCVSMSEDRFVPGGKDMTSIKKLTGVLGKDVWKNGIFVLTFANGFVGEAKDEYDDDPDEVEKAFHQRVKEWTENIHEALQEEVGIDADVANSVRVVPAGIATKPQLMPNSDHWLSNLWFEALFATRIEAQPALIKINIHRFQDAGEIDEDKWSTMLAYQPIMFANIGEKVGEELGLKDLGGVVGLTAGLNVSLSMLFAQLGFRNGLFDSSDVHVVVVGI